MNYPRPRRTAFTLVELLTVIGIIVILIAILLPAVSRVQIQGRAADTQNQINKISGAISHYHQEHGSYPGLLPNSVFNTQTGVSSVAVGGRNITMTENLVISLCGGFEPNSASTATNPQPPLYDESKVGQGPITHQLNATRRRRFQAYIDPTPGQLTPAKPWTNGNGRTGLSDSDLPEFMDRFNTTNPNQPGLSGMPILYMRANAAATGVVENSSNTLTNVGTLPHPGGHARYQYNLTWIAPYVEPNPTTARGSPPFNATDFPSRQNPSTPAGAAAYFAHPNVANTAKGQNQYVLISAGADGLYGTKDDITNIGL